MAQDGIRIERYDGGAVIDYDSTRASAVSDVKRRLNAVRCAEHDLSAAVYELEHLQDMRTRITSALKECTTHGGATTDQRAEATARMVDMEQRLYRDVQHFEAARDTARADIERLRSDKQRAVMYRRYILGWSWDKIAKDLNIGKDAVYRLHGRGLYNISKFTAAEHSA